MYMSYDPCFISGINGTWGDYGGICPYWGQPDCSCEPDVIEVFHEMLDDMTLTAAEWHAMDDSEKQNAAYVSGQ